VLTFLAHSCNPCLTLRVCPHQTVSAGQVSYCFRLVRHLAAMYASPQMGQLPRSFINSLRDSQILKCLLQLRKHTCRLLPPDSTRHRRTARALVHPCLRRQFPHTHTHITTKARSVWNSNHLFYLFNRTAYGETVPQAVPYPMMIPPPGAPGGPPHGYEGGPAPPVPMGGVGHA